MAKNPYRRKKPMTEAHKNAATEGRRRARAAREALAAAQAVPNEVLSSVLTDEATAGKVAQPQRDGASEVMDVPEGVEIPKRQIQAEEPVEDTTEEPAAEDDLLSVVKQLQREMDEMRKANAELVAGIRSGQVDPQVPLNALVQMQGATVGQAGVQGQVFKYPIEKSYYPDPTDRLYDDPKLLRFAMRENFYFKWDVEGVEYTKHNVDYSEPRFIVELWRFIFDPETGEPTGQMFLISRQIQHEDMFVARMAANKMGISFDNTKDLLDEMRYQRIRQWLLGVFQPYKINQYKNKTRQMVIGGKVVEVKDSEDLVSSDTGKTSSETIEQEVKLTPAQTQAAIRRGLL